MLVSGVSQRAPFTVWKYPQSRLAVLPAGEKRLPPPPELPEPLYSQPNLLCYGLPKATLRFYFCNHRSCSCLCLLINVCCFRIPLDQPRLQCSSFSFTASITDSVFGCCQDRHDDLLATTQNNRTNQNPYMVTGVSTLIWPYSLHTLYMA